jgi:hypothetical protein
MEAACPVPGICMGWSIFPVTVGSPSISSRDSKLDRVVTVWEDPPVPSLGFKASTSNTISAGRELFLNAFKSLNPSLGEKSEREENWLIRTPARRKLFTPPNLNWSLLRFIKASPICWRVAQLGNQINIKITSSGKINGLFLIAITSLLRKQFIS